jgi:hypothetical protein
MEKKIDGLDLKLKNGHQKHSNTKATLKYKFKNSGLYIVEGRIGRD